jgi:PAS domain S-box-containing protein
VPLHDPEIGTLLFEHARDIMLVLDAGTGQLLDANEAAIRAYGYTYEELLQLTIFELRADPSKVPQQMAIASAEGILFETTHRRKDGQTFDVEVNSRGHTRHGRALLLSVIRDTSLRKQHEAERRALIETTDRTLGSREEFLLVASHELRAPTTNVSLQLQHLVRMLERTEHEQLVAPVRAALDEVLRLSALMTSLLDAQHDMRGHIALAPTELDLGDCIREVTERLRPRADVAGSPIAVDVPSLRGRWDQLRMTQVFTNLLANAIKFGRGAPIRVEGLAEDKRVIVRVHDQGIGIEHRDAERIFEKFERAVPANYGGLGLGLYVTRQLILAHGGSISVASVLDTGSTFEVVLPRYVQG